MQGLGIGDEKYQFAVVEFKFKRRVYFFFNISEPDYEKHISILIQLYLT